MNFGISPAFEAIDAMVRNIEIGAIVVASILAVWCLACEWNWK